MRPSDDDVELLITLIIRVTLENGFSKEAGLSACASLITSDRCEGGTTEDEFAAEARTWWREAAAQKKERAQ